MQDIAFLLLQYFCVFRHVESLKQQNDLDGTDIPIDLLLHLDDLDLTNTNKLTHNII